MNNTLDVRQLIDQQPIGRYQKWVVFLGFLIIALDGLDVANHRLHCPAAEKRLGPGCAKPGPGIERCADRPGPWRPDCRPPG